MTIPAGCFGKKGPPPGCRPTTLGVSGLGARALMVELTARRLTGLRLLATTAAALRQIVRRFTWQSKGRENMPDGVERHAMRSLRIIPPLDRSRPAARYRRPLDPSLRYHQRERRICLEPTLACRSLRSVRCGEQKIVAYRIDCRRLWPKIAGEGEGCTIAHIPARAHGGRSNSLRVERTYFGEPGNDMLSA
jgi:hypothetical protein